MQLIHDSFIRIATWLTDEGGGVLGQGFLVAGQAGHHSRPILGVEHAQFLDIRLLQLQQRLQF